MKVFGKDFWKAYYKATIKSRKDFTKKYKEIVAIERPTFESQKKENAEYKEWMEKKAAISEIIDGFATSYYKK